MAHVKDRSRGQGSRARRRIREELYIKNLNRKRNHAGCAARSERVNGKDS
jgi:hypothetical protein